MLVWQWFWLFGLELGVSVVLEIYQDVWLGWLGFLFGDLLDLLIVVIGLWLLCKVNLYLSLCVFEDVMCLLLLVVLIVIVIIVIDVVLLVLMYQIMFFMFMVEVFGLDLLSNYFGVLLVVLLMIMLVCVCFNCCMLVNLIMDGLLVMLLLMVILLMLFEYVFLQFQFVCVLLLVLVMFFVFCYGWCGVSLVMIIISMGMSLVDYVVGQLMFSVLGYLFLVVVGMGVLMFGLVIDVLWCSSEWVVEQNVYLVVVNWWFDQLVCQLCDVVCGNL